LNPSDSHLAQKDSGAAASLFLKNRTGLFSRIKRSKRFEERKRGTLGFQFLSKEKENNEDNHVFQKDHRTSLNNCRIPKHRKRQNNGHQRATAMEETAVRQMWKESGPPARENRKAKIVAPPRDLGQACLFTLSNLSSSVFPMRSNHDGRSLGSDRILIYPYF
jgi:hypothetical protein